MDELREFLRSLGLQEQRNDATSQRFSIRFIAAESPSEHTSSELRLGGTVKLPCVTLVAFADFHANPGLRWNSLGSFKLVRGYCLSSRCDC